MKNNKILITLLGIAFIFSSCDKFLDKMPDNRAEVDSESKITSLLVSAYATHNPAILMEFGTDNVMDNGSEYTNTVSQQEIYMWQPVTNEGNDDPRAVWQNYYKAIAAANQALQAIETMGNPANLAPQKSEALLCRAFSMFQLANIFCMSYNPSTADKTLGLPYPETPETTVSVNYTRGTMNELYTKINNDIEAALPNVDDDIYTVPKYHFNVKAAYAFAAKFNLFYMKYDKAVEYATKVVGVNPSNVLRDYTAYLKLGRNDLGNAYVDASNPANLLLVPAYSSAALMLLGTSYPRYKHSYEIASYETYWSEGPWGTNGTSNNFLYYAKRLFGSNQSVAFPKLIDFFEYTDKTAGTGYRHIVDIPLTTDETLLVRAEAYIMLQKYTDALSDLNYWQSSHCAATLGKKVLPQLTLESLNKFYTALPYAPLAITKAEDRSIKKKLNPQGFEVQAGDQENLMQCLLHFRRLETMFTGQRWCDLKRFGIEFAHNIDGSDAIVFKAGDLRGAIQLPFDVINAGLEANPR
jgi:hypothetical protein